MIEAVGARARTRQLRIVIAGAGMGGLALAARLAREGYAPQVFETRNEESTVSEGVFLTLAPNGMNALRMIDADSTIAAAGIDTVGIEILNAAGSRLNLADQRDHAEAFGAQSITIGRGELAAILLANARKSGVELRFGNGVVGVDPRADAVTVRLSDGSSVEADLLVAADGLRSTVRSLVFPDYPKPIFTGLIGTGGTVVVDICPTNGVMSMTFGSNAFFGYLRQPGGPVYWFNSYAADESEIGRIADPQAYARRIEALHSHDPLPNARILAAVDMLPRNYPVYDMPALPSWHRGRVVLMGDAAHAIGPHTGQGASMAIEDAMVLAACLAAGEDLDAAFRRYETLRRARVKRVVELTRKLGSQKRSSGRLSLMIRDLVLPFLIPFGIKTARKLFEYRVDRDPLARPKT